MVYYSERLHVECAVFAGDLIDQGTIGRVIQVLGLGPHRLSAKERPAWFFERARYGGILCDIGSHQIEQFLFYSGASDATVTTSGVALFVAGITIAASKNVLNLEVGVNAVLKMVVPPAFCCVLAALLSVKAPFSYEGLLLTALLSGPVGILLATRYKIYESEASSTVAVTMIMMGLTIPLALFVMRGA